mmetsp:Transcript_43519/g.111278  ORF Transcript_43519/g.111278 Transcript_43519/m.111278 type:complete len:423 (-) Transcript_43519:208-1476(-)
MAGTSPADEYEFLGPWLGPVGIVFGLPAVCYALVLLCGGNGCATLAPLSMPPVELHRDTLYSHAGLGVFLGWVVYVVALHLLLPGKRVQGATLSNGQRLMYKMNGFTVLVATLAVVGYFGFYTHDLDLAWMHTHFLPLLSGSVLFSFALSAYLYLTSYLPGKLLAAGGNTSVGFYNFFIGRELNPRIGSFDLKEFFELYPGLIGWIVLDLGMAASQLAKIGYITNSMVLVCAFHLLYVIDALWYETAILTTMDITTDGFGFMLAFGDITWVPFTYCLQARYLADNPRVLSDMEMGAILALKVMGYWIFRGANGQKNQFRKDPAHASVSHLKTMPTERGTKLLISGWWGVVRHINYTGDWMMGLAWCLPCGYDHIIPYFYAIYFGTLLVHREMRDEHSCQLKYGKDWAKYCSIVKYRLIPCVY